MIQDYILDIANKMGIEQPAVEIVNGYDVGCIDVSLVKLISKGRTSKALVHKADIDSVNSEVDNSILELKIRAALSRLNGMLES